MRARPASRLRSRPASRSPRGVRPSRGRAAVARVPAAPACRRPRVRGRDGSAPMSGAATGENLRRANARVSWPRRYASRRASASSSSSSLMASPRPESAISARSRAAVILSKMGAKGVAGRRGWPDPPLPAGRPPLSTRSYSGVCVTATPASSAASSRANRRSLFRWGGIEELLDPLARGARGAHRLLRIGST